MLWVLGFVARSAKICATPLRANAKIVLLTFPHARATSSNIFKEFYNQHSKDVDSLSNSTIASGSD
jgi:hypothetical protein